MRDKDDPTDSDVNAWCGLLTIALGLVVLTYGIKALLGWTLVVQPGADSALITIMGSIVVVLGVWCFRQP